MVVRKQERIDWEQKREEVKKLYKRYQRLKPNKKAIFYNNAVKPYFEARIKKIEHGIRGSREDIKQKIWGEDGIIHNLFRDDEGNRHGALGELEFLERKILIEKVDVGILPDLRDRKIPDFKLILKAVRKELVTEVKSLMSSKLDRIYQVIREANKKFNDSSSILATDRTLPNKFYKIPGISQGALEIQFIDKYASNLDEFSFDEIDETVRSGLNERPSIVQVSIFKEHRLYLQYIRNRQNEIEFTFIHKDFKKKVAK